MWSGATRAAGQGGATGWRWRLQPVNVVDEVLHTVDEPAVRAELHLAHHVLERDEVADVGRDWVPKVLRSWVEVYNVHASVERLDVIAHQLAVGRLAAAGWPDDQLAATAHGGPCDRARPLPARLRLPGPKRASETAVESGRGPRRGDVTMRRDDET